MKIRNLFVILYLLVVATGICAYATLSKYSSVVSSNLNFTIGNQLFFDYERGDLYLNDSLVPSVASSYIEDGQEISCLELYNVQPEDYITYYFTVKNFDLMSTNNVTGEFFSVVNGMLLLPSKGSTYDITCVLYYREILLNEDGSDASEQNGTFTQLVQTLALPITSTTRKKYEFKVQVNLAGQISGTVADDYFDATLRLNLYFNAASTV